MASLAAFLPKPKAQQLSTTTAPSSSSKWDNDSDEEEATVNKKKKTNAKKSITATRSIPQYGQRGNRKDFVPKTNQDYGDGGAYPEIHVPQYPLDMGRPNTIAKSNALTLTTDAQGNIKYDAILTQHHSDSSDRQLVVHSSLNDLKAKDIEESYDRPDEEAVKESANRTLNALERIVDTKIKATQPKSLAHTTVEGPSYVRYTPQNSSASGAAQSRVIRMVSAQVDPMAPPRYKTNQKIPRGPPSPPPPVLHSPPRKVSVEEQKNWIIPPCVSNWKNAKGFTIPLDKRLAADGRGLQEVTINDNFAKLSEALFIADRHAREEVKIRAEMATKIAAKEKREKEEKLRSLAQRAREERSGIAVPLSTSSSSTAAPAYGASEVKRDGDDSSSSSGSDDDDSEGESDDEKLTEEQRAKMKEREEIRKDKQRQRQREMRLTQMGSDTKAKVLAKSGDRDISEKIALGIAQPKMSKESMYDQRLFNQSAGIGSGFSGGDDSYNLYDKPLFAGGSASTIYRPGRAGDDSMAAVSGVKEEAFERLLGEGGGPHKGFSGADGGASVTAGGDKKGLRDGPVLFEKEDAADPFGLEEFMTTARKGKEKEAQREGRGTMHASSSGKREDYDGRESSGRRMEFKSASTDDNSSKRSRRE